MSLILKASLRFPQTCSIGKTTFIQLSQKTISTRSLYPGHISLNPIEKLWLTVKSGVQIIQDPTKQELIAAIGECTGDMALRSIQRRMLTDPTGRNILKNKPLISSETIDLDWLRQLPKDTFGAHYVGFLDRHQVHPDTRTKVHYVDDPELAYIILRYRQIHDFFHALTTLSISVQHELAIKWFELAQFQLPLTAFSGILGPLTLDSVEREKFRKSPLIGWALEAGSSAKFLLNVEYEKEFETNIHDLRFRLNISLPPQEA